MWVGVGGVIDDLVRIEDDDVGEIPSREPPTPIKTEVRRGKAREAADRFLERDEALLSYVPPEESRERAIRAGVRVGFEEHAFGCGRSFVRPEAHPVEGDLAPHIVLRRDEVARADAALVLDDEVHRGRLRRSAARLRDIRQRLAGEWLERLVLERNEEHAFGAARGEIEVLPVRTRRAHLALDALTEGRIPKPSEPRAKTALLDPRRHARVEPGRTRGVRIHVGGDVESAGAWPLDALASPR